MTGPALARKLSIDPSAEQRKASDPAASVWVNASAGSGKTKVLTDRVTRLLLSGVRPERILCLTFTRAAAAEMALRVNAILSHWAVCPENDLSTSLTDLQDRAPTSKDMTRARRLFAETLACPGGMRIRTLHAFGQEILRRFPIESGLPPHFAVIEEGDARNLQDECLNELLRDPSPPINYLIGALGEKTFRQAAKDVLREKAALESAVARHGSREKLVAKLRATLQLESWDTPENLVLSAFTPAVFDEDKIREAAKILLQGTATYVKRGQKIIDWLELSPEKRIATYNDYSRAFLKADSGTFENYGDKKLLAKHPGLDAVLRREASRLQSLIERCETAKIAATTEAIMQFAHAFNETYTARKRLRAALDYDDLVERTLELLRRPGIAPWILHKLDDGLDHLLVDEAQDTSRAQWEIVRLLAEEFFAGEGARDAARTLFVVGDEKQSIYSFQKAEPEAFSEMRDFFKGKIRQAEKQWREIPLQVSFRSAPAVLRAVDAVFARPEAMRGVSASPVEHVSFKRDSLCGRVELWMPEPRPEKDDAIENWALPVGYENENDPEAELAKRIAETIRGWLAKGETLPGSDHPIRPGDIMILLRRRGRFADLMVRALKKKPDSVPVTGVDRMHLLQQLPVMDLLAPIQFVLLPEDDLNLACVLRGPLLNIGEDDLMQLAALRGKVSLWTRLKESSEPIAIKARDYLTAWLNRADFMTPFLMLTRLLNEPCPGSGISGRRAIWSRLGLDALDPVEELLNAAQNFSRRHPPSLQNFLHWLAASDSEIKRELDKGGEDGMGQVRIMTVHASKGLEAPIVFLPDATQVPRMQDVPNFLWNDHGIPFYLAQKPDSGIARRVWDAARAAQMEEYRRLLYVALTRAGQRLYVAGWEPARKEPDGDMSWHNLVRDGLRTSEAHAQNAAEDSIVWEDPPLSSPSMKTPGAGKKPRPLPAWAFEPAPQEQNAVQTLAPSTFGIEPASATPDFAFTRGRIIHRLLQSLPDVEETKREATAQRFLAQPQHGLNEAERVEISDEVMKLLRQPDFAPLFGKDSRAEVPLAGAVGGKAFAGQVDRLVLTGNEVWIVDYKTNRPPPAAADNIPAPYRAQMAAYGTLLRAIYPESRIRCFLLWTYAPTLMEVPDTAL